MRLAGGPESPRESQRGSPQTDLRPGYVAPRRFLCGTREEAPADNNYAGFQIQIHFKPRASPQAELRPGRLPQPELRPEAPHKKNYDQGAYPQPELRPGWTSTLCWMSPSHAHEFEAMVLVSQGTLGVVHFHRKGCVHVINLCCTSHSLSNGAPHPRVPAPRKTHPSLFHSESFPNTDPPVLYTYCDIRAPYVHRRDGSNLCVWGYCSLV